MRIFSELKNEKYNKLIGLYEKYLPEYFGRLGQAYNDFPEALENEEYNLYVKYNKWPIRRLEYSFVIEKMKEAIFPGATVLDAGCGVSCMPFLWAEFGGKVTAVDFNEKSISLMNRMNAAEYFGEGKEISTNVCDIMQLPYQDNSFDIVTTVSVLEHLPYPNYMLAISELYRVLKVGGILICTCDLNASGASKRRAVCAFSTGDIKKILEQFQGELIDEDLKPEELSISEEQIAQFWLQHYYEGIGYEGNREYVAVGFSIKKQFNEDKRLKLLKYEEMIQELIRYEDLVIEREQQLQKGYEYAKEKEAENKKLISDIKSVHRESEERMEALNRVSKENGEHIEALKRVSKESEERMEALKRVSKESEERMEALNRVSKENGEHIEALKRVSKESEERMGALNRVSKESEERLAAIEYLKNQLEKKDKME